LNHIPVSKKQVTVLIIKYLITLKSLVMKKLSILPQGWDLKYGVSIITVFLLLIPGVLFPVQTFAQSGVVATQSPEGGVAIDGNLLAKTPDSSPFSADDGDFLPNELAPGSGGSVFTIAGLPIDNTTAFHVIDGYDNADMNTFSGGSKLNDDPNTWTWKTGKPPAKDDMNHILFFFSSDVMGNIWFVGAGDRKKVQGNTYMDFELLQNPLYMENDQSFSSMGPDGGRTIGDLAITVEYTIGGTNPGLYIYRWEDTGQGGFGYIPVTPANGTTFLAVNSDSSIVVPYGAYGSSSYEAGAFTELAVNINEVVPGMYACLDIKAVIAKTKASQSITAMLKDIIEPVAVDISSAPVVSLEDTTICFGETATLTPIIHSGTGPYTYEWSTGETTESIMVTPATTTAYWVIVTGVNGCPSDTAYATVTVLPLPDCFIYGPDAICPLGVAQYMAPDTMVSYEWSVYGAGIILGDSTLQVVDVQGTGSCDTSFILELTIVGSNGCSNTCEYIVSLIDTLPPVFTYVPGPLWLECASDVPTASINSVTVEDDCPGNILVMVSDSMINESCTNQFDIIRTWTSIDICGNLSTASQTITVSDNIAPVFTYVPDSLWLDCATEVPAASIDAVSVTDNCNGNIALTVSDSITDGSCVNQFDIIRTWTALDMCGNLSTALQYITVFDSIGPFIYGVPHDMVVCCKDSIPDLSNVNASDNCSISILDSFTKIISDSMGPMHYTLTLIWEFSDICGNKSVDSINIEVNKNPYQAEEGMVGIDGAGMVTSYFRVAPNPFSRETTITFSPAMDAWVDLELYNFLGVRLTSLYKRSHSAGDEVSIPLNGDNLVQGIYMLVLKTKYGVETRKVLITR
jgi:hypothetical protein